MGSTLDLIRAEARREREEEEQKKKQSGETSASTKSRSETVKRLQKAAETWRTSPAKTETARETAENYSAVSTKIPSVETGFTTNRSPVGETFQTLSSQIQASRNATEKDEEESFWDRLKNAATEATRDFFQDEDKEDEASGWEVAKNAAFSGLNKFNVGLASTLDLIAPTDFLGEYDPFSRLNDYYKGLSAHYDQELAESLEGKSKAAQTAANVGSSTVAAIPNAILALMTGGASMGAQGTAALTGAAASAGSTGLAATVGTAAKELAKSPLYWSSVAQTLGPDYDEAKENGASDLEAAASAVISSALNAGVEIGGGLETLPGLFKQGGNSAVRQWVRSMLEEGQEEVVQGVVSGITEKAVYDRDKEWYSTTDEDAVFNPGRMAEEGLMGAAVGGILGGGQMGAISAVNAGINRVNNNRLGKVGADYQVAAEELVNEGLTFAPETEAYQTAQEVKARMDAGETVSDADLGRVVVANERTMQAEERLAQANVPAETRNATEPREIQPVSDFSQEADAQPIQREVPVREAQKAAESVPYNVMAADNEQRQQVLRAQQARESYLDQLGYGERGTETFRSIVEDSSADPGQVRMEFQSAYEAGLTNLPRERAVLSTAIQEEAYNAGRQDYILSMKQQPKQAAVYNNESGFIRSDAAADLDQQTVETFQAMGKGLGAKIMMEEQVYGGRANGSYSDGIIRIAKDAANPYVVVAKHEVTHRMQDLAPKEYRQYRDFAVQLLAEERGRTGTTLVEAYQDRAADAGVHLSAEGAMDEIAADFTERILTDEKALHDFVTSTSKDAGKRSMGQKFFQAVRDFINNVKRVFKGNRAKMDQAAKSEFGATIQQLEKAEQLWKEAYQAAKSNAANAKANAANAFVDTTTGENVKWSLRTKEPPKKVGIAYKVFFAKNGQLYPPMVANPGGEGTPVGVWLDADVGVSAGVSKTGRPQVKAGGKGTQGGGGKLAFRPGWHLGDLPLATQFNRLNPETGKKELFPADFVWAECEYAMDHDYQDEAMSYGYTDNGKFRHAYAGLPRLPEDGYYRYRTNPNPDTVPWVITGAMRVKRILTDAETDQILRDAGVEPLKRQGGPADLAKMGIKAGDTVQTEKYSLKDSEGNTLTKEQQDFFKNSKVRDEKGNLKVMYHGSGDAGFHEFNARFSDDHTSFFFVDSNTVAKSYSGTHEVYAPKTLRTAEDLNEFFQEIGADEYEAAERDGTFYLLEDGDEVAESDTAAGLYDEFQDWTGIGLGSANYKVYLNLTNPLTVDAQRNNWDEIEVSEELQADVRESLGTSAKILTTRQYAELANAKGHDGVIFKNIIDNGVYASGMERFETSTVAIAFKPEQIKSVENKNPTTNPDIRFSLKDSEGRKLSEGQREYFKDSKAVDENGNLLVLYHGTRKGGFTTFRDWAYLTASEGYAKRYADNNTGETVYEVYANITKPFDTRLNECRDLWRKEFFGNYSRTELQDTGLPDWTDGYDLAEWIEENEYDFDGILLDEGADFDHNGNLKERGISYVVRSSEQIKNVDNKQPTGDKDIRFSLKGLDDIKAKYKDKTDHLYLHERRDGTISIDNMVVKKEYRNQGIGTQILDDVIAYADETGKTITLTPTTEFGTKAKLTRWYKANGFVENKGRNADYRLSDTMYRLPKGTKFSLKSPVEETKTLIALHNLTDEKLRKQLEQMGLNVLTYQYGDDASRIEAVNSVDGAKFSLKAHNDLLAENEKLRKVHAALAEQFAVTQFEKPDKKAMDTFAKNLLKDWKSGADINETRQALTELYTFVRETVNGDDPDLNALEQRAYEVAVPILQNVVEIDDTDFQEYKALRQHIAKTGITFDKSMEHNLAGYESLNDFRKAYFGRIRLVNGGTEVSKFYQELESMYPGTFDQDKYSDPAAQLLHIAQVLDELKPTEVNPYSHNMRETATWLASDIIQRIYDLPQAKPTFGDKMKGKIPKSITGGLDEMGTLLSQQEESLERAGTEARRARMELDEAKRTGNTLITTNRALKRQLEDMKAENTRIIEENRQKLKDTIAGQRMAAGREMAKLKSKQKEKLAQASDTKKRQVMRAKILRHTTELSKKLLRASDRNHVPQELQGAVAKLLESINLESNYTYDSQSDGYKKNDQGSPTNRTKMARQLQKLYGEMADELTIDPDLLGSDGLLAEVIGMADLRLVDMTLPELETVWKAVRAIEASVQSANIAFNQSRWDTISEAAEELRADNKGKRDKVELDGPFGILGKAQKLTGLDMMTPEAYFHRLGKGGDGLFRMMRDAQDDHIRKMKEVSDFTHEALKGVNVRKLEDKMHTVKLGGEDVKLSTAQIMELYVLLNREQAREHIMVGGILPDVVSKGGIKKVARAKPVRNVQMSELLAAFRLLSEKEIQIAKKLQEYASTELSKWGNEAAMKVYNYEKFGEKAYWPVRVNRQETQSNVQKDTQVTSVAGRGFTKGTKPHANNSVMIGSIFDTFATHASEMATYAAWLAPMEDINRIRNYTFKSAGNTVDTVKGIIDTVHGKGGTAYLSKLLADLSNGVKGTHGETAYMSGLVGNYKAASVGANLRVIIQQPTAILRALDMIGPQYLTAGLRPANGWKKAKKYAPIAQWKDWGYFDINTGRQMKDVLFDSDSMLNKVKSASMWGAGKADSLSWGLLWNAVETETKHKRKDLKPGTEQFYEAVAERFNEVVDHTQVVDGILQRSQIMRSADGLTKMATSFMGEPTKQYNMMMGAAYDATHGSKDQRKAGKKKFLRAAVTLTISGVANAMAQAIMDAVRDDDKEKEYWEKWFSALTGLTGEEETLVEKAKNVVLEGNLGGTFNPAGYIPYVKDILSIIQGYDVTRMDMESIEKTLSASQNMVKALRGEGKYTLGGASAALFAEVARMAGIPVANLKREVKSFAMLAALETDNYLMQYRMEKASLELNYSGNSGTFLDILFNAYQNDEEAYDIIYADMIASGYAPEKLANGMETRMKKAEGVKKVDELEQRYLHPDQQSEWDRKLSNLQDSSLWSDAEWDQRDKLEEKLYHLVTDSKTGQELQDKIDEGESYGLSETDYLLYTLALDMYDQPNKNGEYGGTPTGEEKAEAIHALGDLSDGEIAFLWDTEQGFEAYAAGLDMQAIVDRIGGGDDVDVDKLIEMRDVGIDERTYFDFRDMLKEVDTPTKSGKMGSYTQKEATAAIVAMPDLTREERAALWQSVNKSWKATKNPWR